MIQSLQSPTRAAEQRFARLELLWTAELKIDEKLRTTPTWSATWWHLISQLNICRRDRIRLRGIPQPGQDPFVRAR